MKEITQKLSTLRYGYKPGEFLPIYEGRDLINKNEFIKYKLRCIVIKRSLI